MKVLNLLILSLVLLVLPLAVPPASAGKCGAFLVYNSGPYPYPDLPRKDYRIWAGNYPSPDAAREAVIKECLKQWEKEKPTLEPPSPRSLGSKNRGAWICGPGHSFGFSVPTKLTWKDGECPLTLTTLAVLSQWVTTI